MAKRFKVLFSLFFMCFTVNNVMAESFKDWNGFGGNTTNNKITYAKTPISGNDITTVASISSSGYVMDPIVINDKMYAVNNKVLTEYNKDGSETGKKVSVGAVGYFSKIAYGDGKIFVAASNYIKAYDFETFEQLWQTAPETNAQAISAITYHNGYIYSGYAIVKSGGNVASDGYFFALSTKDEDQSQDNEVKEYTWKYQTSESGSGYYWSDATIANNAVIFAGENGVLVSHHLTKDIVYDTYELSKDEPTKKVRSAIVYDQDEDYIYVGTETTKELYKIKLYNCVFDRTDITINNDVQSLTGAISIGSKNIYAVSGGMSGKGISVIDKETMKTIGTNMNYGSQSFPLVSEARDSVTYIYYLEYTSGKLLISKDNNDGTMPTFEEYKTDKMDTYNSFSLVPFYDGTLIIGYNGFSKGGYEIIKSSNQEFTKDEIQKLINKTDKLTDYTNHDKILEIEDRVASFKEFNPSITIDNEEKLTNNIKKSNDDIDEKANIFNKQINANLIFNLDNALSIASKISDDKYGFWSGTTTYVSRHTNYSTATWDDLLYTSKSYRNSYSKQFATSLYNLVKDSNNEVDQNLVYKHKGYIELLSNNYLDVVTDEKVSNHIENILDKILPQLTLAENQEIISSINNKITNIPNTISLKNKDDINTLTALFNNLDENTMAVYIESYPTEYTKYKKIVNEITTQQTFIDKLNADIATINPLKITYNDKSLVDSIIQRYNSLNNDNKEYVSDWYQNILDAKKVIDKITIRTEKKGNTTYTYQKKNAIWFLIKADINTSTSRKITSYVYDSKKYKKGATSIYNGVRKTKYYVETKKKNIVTKKETITYNSNVKAIKRVIIQRNNKKKYITTYINTRSYYGNKKVKANKVAKKNLTTGKLTSKKNTYYYNTGKKKRYISYTYKSGKLYQVKDYRYNKKGQLKSNKYGKAYYIKKNYKKGKHQKTYKYKYNSKGKQIKI